MNKIYLVYIRDNSMGYGENIILVGAFTDTVKADEAKSKVIKSVINAKRNNPEDHIDTSCVDVCDITVDLNEYHDISWNKYLRYFDSNMMLGGYVE